MYTVLYNNKFNLTSYCLETKADAAKRVHYGKIYSTSKICSCEKKLAMEYVKKNLASETNKVNQFDFEQSIFNKKTAALLSQVTLMKNNCVCVDTADKISLPNFI